MGRIWPRIGCGSLRGSQLEVEAAEAESMLTWPGVGHPVTGRPPWAMEAGLTLITVIADSSWLSGRGERLSQDLWPWMLVPQRKIALQPYYYCFFSWNCKNSHRKKKDAWTTTKTKQPPKQKTKSKAQNKKLQVSKSQCRKKNMKNQDMSPPKVTKPLREWLRIISRQKIWKNDCKHFPTTQRRH